ncbi:GGDEF domain-containing protein [Sporomusaceae bacterium FL31]|nr:GGDEF domain-containing protein [Sporomusaceae bacterium FL31]GCE34397.1 GGDEF domain-containing protein [Sporomusaceae bacterium]
MSTLLLQAKNIQEILNHLYEGIIIVDTNKVVVYWNPEAEKISGYLASEFIGRCCCDKSLVHVDQHGERLCEKSCPFTASLCTGQVYETEAYLNHKEGHQVPVSARMIPLYDNHDKFIGAIELFRDNSPRETLMKELADLNDQATIDPLTGLRNRRYAEVIINSKLNEIRSGGTTFGVLFIDIDHFKTINDTYGHDVGDLVLKMLARTLMNNTRQHDVLVRWGGEEIVAVIVSPNIQTKLTIIADKLRHLIGQSILPVDHGTDIQVTVSIGATVAQGEDTVQSLVKRADHLMYQAKKSGRNCVKTDIEIV